MRRQGAKNAKENAKGKRMGGREWWRVEDRR
jgi:hypothetical protein